MAAKPSGVDKTSCAGVWGNSDARLFVNAVFLVKYVADKCTYLERYKHQAVNRCRL